VLTYGRFSIPVNRPGTLTRNAFAGPDFRSADLRLSKAIPLGRRRIELLAEAFNITNRVNFNGYQGSIQSRLFGMPQSGRRQTGSARRTIRFLGATTEDPDDAEASSVVDSQITRTSL
jgi:predicted ester cyclase